MHNFHSAWFAFFTAFFVWFAIAPIIPEIKNTLNLTKDDIWNSSIAGVGGTIVVRIALGPICDRYGPKIPMVTILWIAAICTSCVGFVESANGLIVLRTFIGFAGGSFVMCTLWSTLTFTKEIAGSSNGIAAGWGNLGAGVTNIVMGTILFPLFRMIFDGNAEKSWRFICVIPAVVTFCSGLWILKYSDDTPKGNYGELKTYAGKEVESYNALLGSASMNMNTWLLAIQYATCFGVEIAMNNAISLYFTEEFGQSTESAAALAAIFGWLNLFARGLGGILSDWAHAKLGMRGRIIVNTALLFAEGVMVLVFAQAKTIGPAVFALIVFSIFVKAAEGSCFGIVPYVDYPRMASITGIVGAAGNVGAVFFLLAFRLLDYASAFRIMGFSVLGSCFLSFFISIPGQSKLIGFAKTRAIPPFEQESEQRA